MACTCIHPIPVQAKKRGWGWNEWSQSSYCGTCGESLRGNPGPIDRAPSVPGVDPRLGARKEAGKAKARARRADRLARDRRNSDDAGKIAAGSDIEGLQQGDKIIVRRVIDPYSLHVYPTGRYDGLTRGWVFDPFVIKPGMIFRITRVDRRAGWGRSRITIATLEGVGEGLKGRHLSLSSGRIVFERMARSYEKPPRTE